MEAGLSLLMQADVLYMQHRYLEAAKFYSLYLKNEPEASDVWLKKAFSFYLGGLRKKALEEFEEILQKWPFLWFSVFEFLNGKEEVFLQKVALQICESSKDPAPLLWLYYRTGSIFYLKEVFRFMPHNPEVLLQFAKKFGKRYPSSLRVHLIDAYKKYPSDEIALLVSLTFYYEGSLLQALEWLEKVSLKRDSFFYSYRGFLKRRLGRVSEALFDFKKALSMDKANTYAKRGLFWCYYDLYLKEREAGHSGRALYFYKKTLQLAPEEYKSKILEERR